MATEVKKGGRTDFVCAGCGEIIPKGEAHFRTGTKDYKRYHKACLPVKGAKAEKTVTEPEPAAKPVDKPAKRSKAELVADMEAPTE